ncbi:MAG: KdsC family phosphatase [Chitinophagales bacterium]
MVDLEQFKPIKTLIFDVDGVLTDGSLIISETGHLQRKMNVKDGYAMKKAMQAGLQVVIITGGNSQGVYKRLRGLGITDIYMNSHHKIADFEELLFVYELKKENILYMGDDMPDFEVMQQVGLPVCPKDAIPEIRMISKYISSCDGGKACVREVIELVLKAQGKWS